ncbi:MAG: LON peptidase substrate-binding domain-containing protein [Pseudomonadota bacterium]
MSKPISQEIPLFPLGTVLFPDGILPLRIFEPRYVDMVGRCMRKGEGFGVVLIRQGPEARISKEVSQPDIFTTGTLARIVDFNQADNGLLGIVCRGERKFEVLSTHEQSDHLLIGEISWLDEEPTGELLEEHQPLVDVLKELSQHPLVKKLNVEIDFDQARSVSLRLADLLPIEPEIKQTLLQMRWPKERLNELLRLVRKFQG